MRVLVAAFASIVFASSAGCAGGMGASTSRLSPSFLRQNTVSVHVEASPRIAELFGAVAERMKQSGKAELAEFFTAQTGGAFGSGFAVRRGGETFIVTNRHVVDFADEAEISVDGSNEAVPVDVIYADKDYDLAVLSFREQAPRNLPGLRLSSTHAHDLETVIATGYPGLDGRPSYQITRGQISNERFSATSRGHTITLLQHTAPIDPGSSGGPLANESGAVVGVNFVKYEGRDNVYLAIPVDAVSRVIDAALETKRGLANVPWLVDRLGKSCGTLVGGLRHEGEPSVDVYDLITNDVIAERGFESVEAMSKRETKANREELWSAFVENPTAIMRVAVAERLWKEAHGKEGLPVTCLPLQQDPKSDTLRLLVKFERGTRETFWRFEQGSWKLAAFDKMIGTPPSKPTKRRKR
ncbi:serine protease [Labilithrix luteola]|uniref:Serine protease n=1 Tax=Labilithrix luteola TaxID=1391654 RepID=A0A0K1PS25_9BACT|nr:serine protease [Labilithrix luteola]AKU96317.1 serine protease [Labilithrix luteola]